MPKKTKDAFPGFAACMQLIRRRKDPAAQEDGYEWLYPRAHEFVEPLLAELASEEDPFIQGWILELLGDAHTPQAFPVFVPYLLHPNVQLQQWASRGLRKLMSTREGRQVIWEATLYGIHLPPVPSSTDAQIIQTYLETLVQEGNEGESRRLS